MAGLEVLSPEDGLRLSLATAASGKTAAIRKIDRVTIDNAGAKKPAGRFECLMAPPQVWSDNVVTGCIYIILKNAAARIPNPLLAGRKLLTARVIFLFFTWGSQ
jgi:hypothetical protein